MMFDDPKVVEAQQRLDRDFEGPSRKGWSKQTLKRLDVGLDTDGRYVIPVRTDDGVLCAVLRYSDNGAFVPKLKSVYRDVRELFPAPEVIADDELYVVEGEPDAISATELGLTAVGIPGVSHLKSQHRSANWAYRVTYGRKRVTVIPDCEREARELFLKFARECARYTSTFVLDMDSRRDDGYDVGDLMVEYGEWAPVMMERMAAMGKRVDPVELSEVD
jgi:hypothetical protein